ncbi:MAG: DMT family transporter [Clostridia bacterium]|nr:DMT family transporter [Clostridia bacterium]
MTVAVIITLLASFLWAITNHIDKYMLCKIDNDTSNVKTLLVFSSFVAGIVLSPIWLCISKFQIHINVVPLIFIFVSAILYILATYFYFKALEKNDASIVVVMFQLIPVFSYIFSLIFFKETLNIKEIIGALIIISSAIIISFDFGKTSNKNKLVALLLMALSSLLYSLYFICFDVAMRNGEYNAVAFWYQIGLLLIGICLISIKSFRTAFIKMLKSNGKKFIPLNITNEAINLIANLMVNFANLTIPLALANTLNGFQSAFVFIIGVIGVALFPKIISEDLNKRNVLQKVFCIGLGIIGLVVMFN